MCSVLLNGKWGYIDTKVNEVITLIYSEADSFLTSSIGHLSQIFEFANTKIHQYPLFYKTVATKSL
ncbi:MAG: WG repeat-containing protein [Prevotellaceae bacterium]|nr:WG repeat-containing protein [Prevotellaceae bacterium]